MARAAELYGAAADECRDSGYVDGWVRAVLALAETQVWSEEPGEVPARLHEIHGRLAPGADRARIAAALARSWAYAGEPRRAASFAREAQVLAGQSEDVRLRTLALGAAMVAHWGPDDLAARRRIAAELVDAVAYTRDAEALLRAHRWAFEVAAQELDVAAMTRHLAVLDRVGTRSAKARFFAASRRSMVELLRGDVDSAVRQLALAQKASQATRMADAWMVLVMVRASAAVEAADTQTAVTEATAVEGFARKHGIAAAAANAAHWWAAIGEFERAAVLVRELSGPSLAKQPRDVNWLPTTHLTLLVATEVGELDAAAQAADLLAGYAGRCVMDVGAVAFLGLTDDSLARGAWLRGDRLEAGRLRDRALSTYRRIGARWWADRLTAAVPGGDSVGWALLPGADVWRVGRDAVPVPAMRGLGYLHALLMRAGVDVAALDLVGAERGHASVQQPDAGAVADPQALAAYRARLTELQQEVDEARDWGDLGRLEVREAERDALLAEIGRTTGLGGRARRTGSSAERARVAVRKAIVTAIDRLEPVDADLAAHLRAHVHTGAVCRYDPATPPVSWILQERRGAT